MSTSIDKPQRGASLVVVTMLTSVAAAVVFSVLNTTLTQNRISGNFQKAINAEYMADKAIYDSYHKLNALVKANPTISDQELASRVLQNKLQSSDNRHYASQASVLKPGMLDLATDGYFYHDSQSKSRVLLRRFSGNSGGGGTNSGIVSPYGYGLLGCDGVNLGGLSSVISYNSVKLTPEHGTVIGTLTADAGIVIPAGIRIDGDVTSTGPVTLSGGSSVIGNVAANGDVELAYGAWVTGNVNTLGKTTFRGSNAVSGSLYANGAVTFTGGLLQGTTIGNDIVTSSSVVMTSLDSVGRHIYADGNVTIDLGSVGGNVSTGGNYVHTGVNVPGFIKANGNVTLNQGGLLNINQGGVGAGVFARGNVLINAGATNVIRGGVRAVKDVQITQSLFLGGTPIANNDLRYGGKATVPSSLSRYTSAPYKVTPAPTVELVPPVTPVKPVPKAGDTLANGSTVKCDSIGITPIINQIKASMPATAASLEINYLPIKPYHLTPARAYAGNSLAESKYQPQYATVFGTQKLVHFYKNLQINSHIGLIFAGGLRISGGHVVMFIDGDLEMYNTAEILIESGSSLTLFITGKVKLFSGNVVTPAQKITADGVPVFSIYSSYVSRNNNDNGFILGGGLNTILHPLYAAVYMPFAHAEMGAASGFAGSMIAKSITVNGLGHIKYDTALSNIKVGVDAGGGNTGTGTPRVTFSGWG